jgi:serpin B
MLVTALLLAALCPHSTHTASAQSNSAVPAATNRFGFKLFSELSRSDPSTNILISPASIALALSVAYNGAGGETRDEMGRCLELHGLTLDEVNSGYAALLKGIQAPGSSVDLQIATSRSFGRCS